MKRFLTVFLLLLSAIVLTGTGLTAANAWNLPQPAPITPIDPNKLPNIPVIPVTPEEPKIPSIPIIPWTPIDPGKIPPLPQIPSNPETPKVPKTPATAAPIPKPATSSSKFVTSEGPLFLMFRGDLTERYEMFTPLDLSVDGDYFFPLVSSAMQTVGEVKVTVANGMVTVKPLVVSGVTLKKGLLTFFADMDSVKTIKPNKLKKVSVPFNMPINVESRFETDARVLMYINCPVSYKKNTPGLSPFSVEDPAYLERVQELILWMD